MPGNVKPACCRYSASSPPATTPNPRPIAASRAVSRPTSRASRPGLTPSASITPNSRVRSSTDINWVLSTLKATSRISTAYITQALTMSERIAWRRPGCS